MTGLNNFITDLLDEMILNDARFLEITPSSDFPIAFIFESDQRHAVHAEIRISEEELLEDLAALGFDTPDSYFYDYESGTEKLSVKCSIHKASGPLTVYFFRSDFAPLAQKAIDQCNPVREDMVMNALLMPYLSRSSLL